MASRATEDFVRHYELLVKRTGNSPNNVRAALGRDGQLAVSIRQLDVIWKRIEEHRRFSKRRFIYQSHSKFHHSLKNYEARWTGAIVDLWDWEAEQSGEATSSEWLFSLLDESPSVGEAGGGVGHAKGSGEEPPEWIFDPDRHSAASALEFVEEFLQREAESVFGEGYHEAACSRAVGALKWIRETVGLDLGEFERRWKEFPVITVPQHVSDKHGIEDPHSLFAYLSQVRLAYIVGADLAAIAMCRAATEILVRVHYNGGDKRTDLGPLINTTEKRRDGSVLKKWNVGAKVKAANDILHVNQDDIAHRDRSRGLIRDWVQALQDMIVDRGRASS